MSIGRGRIMAVLTMLLLLSTIVVVLTSGTSAEPAASTGGPTATPTPRNTAVADVIVPGRPGESAVIRPGTEVGGSRGPGHNTLDVWFVRMMIPHHIQAVEMAALAPDRAADPGIRALADRIRASQTPEVAVLRGWLEERGLPLEDQHHHDVGAMRGMQTPEAMRRLAAARGDDFDRLFVDMMTDHHRGAVEMATNLLKVGADLPLSEFATSVAVEQSVEIERMRDLLDR